MILKPSQSLAKDLIAGFSFKAADHSAAIANHVQVVPNNQWSWDIRNAPSSCPPDVSIGYISRAGGVNGEKFFRDA